MSLRIADFLFEDDRPISELDPEGDFARVSGQYAHVAIVAPQAAPMKRLREEAAGRGKLVDVTQGRRTRSIIVTDSDHVILSAINPDTIASRFTLEGPVGGDG